ncbi:Glycoside hydrolase family 2 protein [Mycena sanguinolenta]|uniref:Beta-mannosidase A n=1 Tax=Mycena sanguinolenta TaxID=230812 RepID=A0A8H6ZFD5_9AGAR|nr:Glycoside hydrolase family 2 protein [Mycena sanguinolenta]
MKWAWVLSVLVASGSAQLVTDLSGSGWTLRSQNGSISVPASVPSLQYIDLYNAKVIGDPLYGFNNTDQSWVPIQNWTYTRALTDLQLTGALTDTYLVFQGLDTFAHITLCNEVVGDTNNMFRQYIFDVSTILHGCRTTPELSINFGSAENISHALSASPDMDPDDNFADSCSATSAEFSCKAYARKEQSDFGWDWAPSLVPAGPWQPIYAVQMIAGEVYVENALIDIYRKGQQNNLSPDQSQPWVFNASFDLVGTLTSSIGMSLTLEDNTGKHVLAQTLSGIIKSAATITGSTTIAANAVELWWPNGMGTQTMYTATVTLTGPLGVPIASVSRPVGFRTIVLNLSPISSAELALGIAPGAHWHFEVNGQPFYAKGANLVPPDPLWPRVNATHITQLFELAVKGNMNMFRVWSSGAYLPDWIYAAADEAGILLWSEFQFSDAEYPNATVYLENYEAEAYYNTRRVNHHPSLALWAGGNELEAIILFYFFSATAPGDIQKQYEQIFLEVLPKCVYANSKSISYIPSSTYHGWLSLNFSSLMPQVPRYLNTTGPDALYADTDVYNYDAPTLFDITTYPIGRFADEFGFHSMPSSLSWATAAAPDQLYYASETVINHNRHYPFGATGDPDALSLAGITEMTAALEMYLPVPAKTDAAENFTCVASLQSSLIVVTFSPLPSLSSAWCWSTQVVQADDIAHQIAFYRRGSGMPERQMGALFWMFNDLWVAPTWAAIESTNRQKVLYYSALDIFSPVIINAYYNTSGGTSDLQIWVTSDLFTPVSGTVSYSWVNYAGAAITVGTLSAGTVSVIVGAVNSTQVAELHYPNLNSALAGSGVNATDALLQLSVSGTTGSTTYTHNAVFHPATLAQAALRDPGLVLEAPAAPKSNSAPGSTYTWTVSAPTAAAAFVWLDVSTNAITGYWNANGFWMKQGESRSVVFTVWEDWSNGKWVDGVTVRSVWDNTLP